MEGNRRIKQFEDLIVWKKANDLARDIFLLSSRGSFQREYLLKDQLRKSALSIVSNIAEGYGRFNPKELRQFLSIANGSAFETRAQIHLAGDLGYFSRSDTERLTASCVEISKMLRGLKRSVEQS